MSVPRQRRKRLFAAAVSGVTVAFATAATAPVPVKTGAAKRGRAGGGGRLVRVVEEPRAADEPVRPLRATDGRQGVQGQPEGTQAYAGGIDGTTLVYQLIRGQLADRSDLRLYDLATQASLPIPPGSTRTVGVLRDDLRRLAALQPRPRRTARDRQLVLLRNLRQASSACSTQLRNRNGLVSAGQLNGTFAVWANCNPYPRCQIFRYDIATGPHGDAPPGREDPVRAVGQRVRNHVLRPEQPRLREVGAAHEAAPQGAGPRCRGPRCRAHLTQRRARRDDRIYFDRQPNAHRIFRVDDTDRPRPTSITTPDLLRQRPLPDAQLEHLQRRRHAADHTPPSTRPHLGSSARRSRLRRTRPRGGRCGGSRGAGSGSRWRARPVRGSPGRARGGR